MTWQQVLAESLPWEGARVRSRAIVPADAALYVDVNGNPDVRRFVGPPLTRTVEETTELLERGAGVELYVVESLATGEPLGYCGFASNPYIGAIEPVTYLLPPFHGQGYGKDVLLLLRDAWISRLNNTELFATVWPENRRAIATLQSQGFRPHGSYLDNLRQEHCVYRYTVSTRQE